MRRLYTVAYCMFFSDKEHTVDVYADCKEQAYNIAVYYEIPHREDGVHPYSAWVKSTTYKNGKVHEFYTFEGKRF